VKNRPTRRVKDLLHGPVPLRVWLRKRRYVCREQACARRSFTEVSGQLPARARLTSRLRDRVATVVTASNRAVSDVAVEYALAWNTVHRVLVAAATALTVPPGAGGEVDDRGHPRIGPPPARLGQQPPDAAGAGLIDAPHRRRLSLNAT